MAKTLRERIWANVQEIPFHECYEWSGYIEKHGYGRVRINSKAFLAHRVVYELEYGSIPPGLLVRHKCDNRTCVRPEHLELGTHSDNMWDMSNRGRNKQTHKTHCPQGHEYSGANLYVSPKGDRNCRTCHRNRERARKVVR